MIVKIVFYETSGQQRTADMKLMRNEFIPRKGDVVKDNDLTYIVQEVVFDYDRNVVTVVCNRPEIQLIPSDAHSFEVFAISDALNGKQVFVGFKVSNGDSHFIQVPYKLQEKKETIPNRNLSFGPSAGLSINNEVTIPKFNINDFKKGDFINLSYEVKNDYPPISRINTIPAVIIDITPTDLQYSFLYNTNLQLESIPILGIINMTHL